MRLREAMGRAVVARDTAETLGQLHGAVVDVAAGRILALQVGKGHKARLADWSSVTGVGPDAAVVDSEASLRAGRGEREERVVKGDIPLLGGRVLTDRGNVVGALDDLEFDEVTGQVQALVCGQDVIAGARLRSVGGYALVVAAEPPASGVGAEPAALGPG